MIQQCLCAHSYCIPAPTACISTPVQHFCMRTLLYASHSLRAHFYSVPALSAWSSTALQHSLHAFLSRSSTFCVHFHCASVSMYFFRLLGLGVSNVLGGFLDCFGMLLGCLTFWGAFWLLLGWTVCMHFYCIPALFACISFLHAIRLITSFLYSSTACVHIYSVLALFCVHSSYDSAMSLCAFLLHSSTDCVHSHSSPTLLHAYTFITPHIFSVRISTVFQHCRREVLLHCSILCIHFYSFLVHFYSFL